MGFELDQKSLENLFGVNIELAKVILKAAEYSEEKFRVERSDRLPSTRFGMRTVWLRNYDDNTDLSPSKKVYDAVEKAGDFWGIKREIGHSHKEGSPVMLDVHIPEPNVESTYYGELL